jgi:hypothetical protein
MDESYGETLNYCKIIVRATRYDLRNQENITPVLYLGGVFLVPQVISCHLPSTTNQ